MAYENISFNEPHMALREGYFYLLDYTRRMLSQKLSNGGVGFQYPINIPETFTNYEVSNVKCLQYDGYSFWSMQDFLDDSGVLIRQWCIENFLCNLINQLPKVTDASITYSSSTFSIEYYNTLLISDAQDGSYIINMEEYTNSVVYPGTVIGLGPNKFGLKEVVTVSGVNSEDIILTTPLRNNYYSGENVTITPSIFLFNNYFYKDDIKGALITIDPYSGNLLSLYGDVEYSNIEASKFTRLQNVLQNYSNVHTLTYTKGTNLKLRDISDMYRYKADITATDYFNDSDGSLPNEDLWEISNGNPSIQNNSLFFSTPGGAGHDSIQSKYYLVGDFSLTSSGSLDTFTTFSGGNSIVDEYIDLNFLDGNSYGINLYYSEYYPLLEDDCVANYRFDGNVDDESPYGNDGSVVGSPALVTGVGGSSNSAYQFNNNGRLVIPNSPELEVGKNGSDFSVLFWIKLNVSATGYWRVITNKSNNSTAERTWAMWVFPDNNKIHYKISTTTHYSEGGDTVNPLPVGSWTQVAYIKEGNQLRMYFNTNHDSTADLAGTVVSNDGSIVIGDDDYYNGINADIDNFRVFARALSVPEIIELYERDLINDYNYYTADSTSFLTNINGVVNDSQFVCSGIAPQTFNFRLHRIGSTTTFGYQTVTPSGIVSEWHDFTPIDTTTSECLVSMGMKSELVTVSGAGYKEIVYDKGYLRLITGETPYYGIMTMDNVQTNQSTIHKIYALDIDGDNLYRLQKTATYYGNNYSWSTYNFQMSPLRSFIDFITIDADTHILPATGRNTTPVRSITLDQYGQGVINRPVTFTDDDNVGFITTEVVHTDIFYNTGKANTAYTSGTDLRVVAINAKVTQLD